MNQVFICTACGKLFADRQATQPVPLDLADAVVQEQLVTPHPKYPDDRELDTVTWQDVPAAKAAVPAVDAAPCCATYTVLCSSTHLRLRRDPKDNTISVVGAEHLE